MEPTYIVVLAGFALTFIICPFCDFICSYRRQRDTFESEYYEI